MARGRAQGAWRDMTDEEILRQFTREMMGSSVAHMTDDQLDAWRKRTRLTEAVEKAIPDFPLWFIKRRDEARRQLLAVLAARSEASPS